MKEIAIWKKCSDFNKNHEHLDSCSDCAPWWDEYPVCPHQEKKIDTPLPVSGWCKQCKKYHDVDTRACSHCGVVSLWRTKHNLDCSLILEDGYMEVTLDSEET